MKDQHCLLQLLEGHTRHPSPWTPVIFGEADTLLAALKYHSVCTCDSSLYSVILYKLSTDDVLARKVFNPA